MEKSLKACEIEVIYARRKSDILEVNEEDKRT